MKKAAIGTFALLAVFFIARPAYATTAYQYYNSDYSATSTYATGPYSVPDSVTGQGEYLGWGLNKQFNKVGARIELEANGIAGDQVLISVFSCPNTSYADLPMAILESDEFCGSSPLVGHATFYAKYSPVDISENVRGIVDVEISLAETVVPDYNSRYYVIVQQNYNSGFETNKVVLMGSPANTTNGPHFGSYARLCCSGEYDQTWGSGQNDGDDQGLQDAFIYLGYDANNDTNNAASSSLNQFTDTFKGIPGYFAERIPWGWLYEFRDTYTSATSTGTDFNSLSYDFASSSISSSTKFFLPSHIEVLSTTTVTKYLNGNLLNGFNTLVAATIWISFALYLFRRVQSI